MSFNWRVYKTLNPDLRFSTQIEYERHYLEYGRKERRPASIFIYYRDFNHKDYQDNYKDLQYYSKKDLEVHWLLVGQKEGRTYKKILKWIYIINGVGIGGTKKYIDDLVTYYGINYRIINSKKELVLQHFKSSDIILIQQLVFTDITPDDIIHLKKTKNPKIFIVLHDFSYLNKNIYNTNNEIQHKIYIQTENDVIPQVQNLFKIVNNVICPSKFVYDQYSNYINNSNFLLVNHTDYKCDMNRILVPSITNTINIGVFNNASEIKGSEYVSYLMKKYTSFNEIKINYYVVGITIGNYKEEEFFQLITKYNIHGYLLLNKYGESWCYLLTKYLFSGLPLLYNNIGSFKERITPLENRFSVGDIDGLIDIYRLDYGYEEMLKYIVTNSVDRKKVWTDGSELVKPAFYTSLFNT